MRPLGMEKGAGQGAQSTDHLPPNDSARRRLTQPPLVEPLRTGARWTIPADLALVDLGLALLVAGLVGGGR